MAAGNFTIYNEAKEDFLDGTFDWVNDNHYMMLTIGHTPDATDTTRADIDADEIADGDYNKEDMGGESAVQTGGTVNVDATDVEFGPSATITARHAHVLQGQAGTSGSGDLLVGYVELDTGGDVSSTNGDFTVQWHTNGVFTAT